jgi:hypothetical protein
MNKRVKQKWVDALRSGKYVQGDGFLRQAESDGGPDRFCCLGVLCEIAVDEGVIAKPKPPEDDYEGYLYARTADQFLPKTVVKWANLSSSNPDVSYSYENDEPLYDHLSSLNDEGRTFEQIANYIEESL